MISPATTASRQVDAVIGASWRLSSKPNARSLKIDPGVASDLASDIEAAWKNFAEDPDCWCDAGRQLSMGGLLALAFRHRLMDGEALAVIFDVLARIHGSISWVHANSST